MRQAILRPCWTDCLTLHAVAEVGSIWGISGLFLRIIQQALTIYPMATKIRSSEIDWFHSLI